MASLTHVCMWSKNGWKHITSEEASKLCNNGSVSASSRLFMCELCGQYVTLAGGKIQSYHFRHSAHEKSKDCPERMLGNSYNVSYKPLDHELPIRITNITESSFQFEIGLIRVPENLLHNNFQICINLENSSNTCLLFSKERIKCYDTTYLSIGEIPFTNYEIKIINGDERLYEFWPQKNKGVNPEGTLFEKISGKKIVYGSDVEINKEYYLLKRGLIYKKTNDNIRIQKISQKRIYNETWYLYNVCVSKFNEESAKFYMDFHYYLSDYPISLQPIWPLFLDGNNIIKHNQNSMYILIKGNLNSFNTFPSAKLNLLSNNSDNFNLYEVECLDREQLISIGRIHALQYTYFWKEPINQINISPQIHVTDINGLEIAPGNNCPMPINRTLYFKLPFDGEIVISKNNCIINKIKAYADKTFELSKIALGESIQVVIGLDIIWEISFINRDISLQKDDSVLLNQLVNISGQSIPVPHDLRNILSNLYEYPSICQWIKKCIKTGKINERAYRRLQYFYINKSKEKKYD